MGEELSVGEEEIYVGGEPFRGECGKFIREMIVMWALMSLV